MGGVWAPTVSFLAVLFLAPLGWVAIWRGKRDGRRPWCDLSYTEPAVAAVAFLVGIELGISITGSDAVSRGTPTSGIVALSGILALMIAGIVTLTLILLAGGRRPHPEQRVQSQSRPCRARHSCPKSATENSCLAGHPVPDDVPAGADLCGGCSGCCFHCWLDRRRQVTKKALTNDLISSSRQQGAAEQNREPWPAQTCRSVSVGRRNPA